MARDSSLPYATAPTVVRSRSFLLTVVLLAGVGTLGIEMVAPRMLAPFFGTSQPIWAAVIGLTLIYLAIGYHLGGRLADRYPDEAVLYRLIAWAGFLTGLIPVVAHPILRTAQQSLDMLAAGAFLGALVAVLLLFAAPVILLAMVGPFAVRLQFSRPDVRPQEAGRTTGTISALSTVGSIIGTYLTVLVIIPSLGTAATTYLFALFLLLTALAGLRDWRYLVLVAIIAVLAAYTTSARGSIKTADCEGCRLIYETESAYNYIQVAARDIDVSGVPETQTYLVLNEGQATHSLYRSTFGTTGNAADLLSGGPWDYFLAAPFVYANRTISDVQSLALLGAAAGTTPKQFLATFGPQTRVDAVEIDPAIIEVGRRFFALEDQDPRFPNYRVYAQDARYWLASNESFYDVIGMDAYHQPYIPFHLTTVEFFRLVQTHLTDEGVAVVNVGISPGGDKRLVEALAITMSRVFAEVYMIDTLSGNNTILIGTRNPVGDGVNNLLANASQTQDVALRTVLEWSFIPGNIRRFDPATTSMRPFTDDHAPVEWLVDSMIIGEAGTLSR